MGGQGEEDARIVVIRTGTNYTADWNDREVFYPASSYETTAGLNSAGDAFLYSLEARDELTFDVLQVPSTLYGKDYFLGDLVTAYYEGVTATKKISAVTVSVTPNSETPESVKVETSNA